MGFVRKEISKKTGSHHIFSCSFILYYQTNANNLYCHKQMKVKCIFQLINFPFSGVTFPYLGLQLSTHNRKFYRLVYVRDRRHFDVLLKTQYSGGDGSDQQQTLKS